VFFLELWSLTSFYRGLRLQKFKIVPGAWWSLVELGGAKKKGEPNPAAFLLW
jgi:hypothetical protein